MSARNLAADKSSFVTRASVGINGGLYFFTMDKQLAKVGVVPVVVLENAADAVPLAEALVRGGLPIVEVTLRTEAAPDAIARIAKNVPDAIIGAGTVLTPEQVALAKAAGAKFIVCPGLHEATVRAAQKAGLPVYPGVSTATEAQAAWNLGLRTLKFFPAGQAGGIPMLKALSSVFRGIQFMPTGGVSAENLPDYLALSAVVACGGSWLTPADAIAEGDFELITRLAKEAVAIASAARNK